MTQVEPALNAAPDWIYFEYNRAFWTEFHYADGHWETHDFRVDREGRTLSIAKKWLTPGSDIFEGVWSRRGDQLTLTGTWNGTQAVRIELARKSVRVKDHD